MHRTNRRTALLAAAALATLPLVASAQTSGSWILNGSGNWSDPANWFPDVPGGGGMATFSTHPLQPGGRTITLDVPVTLNSILVDSPFAFTIAGTETLTLIGPATVHVPTVGANTPTTFPVGSGLTAPLAGSAGFTKTGPGIFTLGNAGNSFTGGVTVTGGVLRTSVADAGFGDPSNTITLDGGALRISAAAITSARNIMLGAGGGTFEMFFAGTFSGSISGPGALNKTISGNLGFQGINTYTGASNFVHEGTLFQNFAPGTVFFQQTGAALATSAVNSSATISLDNAAMNFNNRLNPVAPVRMNGAALIVTGNAAEPTTNSIGDFTAAAGHTFVTVTPNAAQSNTLTMASWSRDDRATTVFRGVGLGGTPGPNVANILITTPPALVGGGGAPGSTNQSIIPGAVGGLTATATGLDLVTYGPNGVRPLSNAAGEYASLAAAGPTDNVRNAAATATNGDQTINALVLGSGAFTGPDTITLTSGMMINSTITTHTANINFGPAEGVLHMTSSATFNNAFSGTGGLTKSGTGIGTFSNDNTYSGTTTIVSGEIRLRGDVPLNAPSALGNSSDPVILLPGTTAARLWATTDVVIDRDLIVRGGGTGTAGFGTTGSTQLITMNGRVVLERQLEGQSGASNPITYNGLISGPGYLRDSFSTMSIINGNNTAWTGGIEVNTGHYYAGHDNAFGTGPIHFTGIGTIGAAGGSRTIPNSLVIFNPTTVNFGASPLVGGPFDLTVTGSVDLGSATRTLQVPAAVTATLAGVVDRGGITKTGMGTLRLTGANEYTGGTTVNDGVLDVSNTSGSGTGSNFVQINAATLTGTGTIAGPVTIADAGALSPGGSAGTLTSGPLTLNDATSLFWDLDMPGVVGGGVNDLMRVMGDLVLDGVLTVTPGTSFGVGDYTLMTYTGMLTDNGLMLVPLSAPLVGSIDTSVPGEVRLVVIPEPATVGLAGLAAFAGLLRRRRAAR